MAREAGVNEMDISACSATDIGKGVRFESQFINSQATIIETDISVVDERRYSSACKRVLSGKFSRILTPRSHVQLHFDEVVLMPEHISAVKWQVEEKYKQERSVILDDNQKDVKTID